MAYLQRLQQSTDGIREKTRKIVDGKRRSDLLAVLAINVREYEFPEGIVLRAIATQFEHR